MDKALKSFIVLNLLLGLVVVVLGFMSFAERRVLKAQSLELEKAAASLAESLQWGEEVPWEQPEDRKELAFSLSQPAAAGDLGQLKQELDGLSRFATQRMAQVNQGHIALNQTSGSLADTRDSLRTREREHTAALNQERQLTATLTDAKSDLADARSTQSTLQGTKTDLEGQLTSKTSRITDLNNSIASLEIDLETRTQQRDTANAEYERIRRGAMGIDEDEGGDGGGSDIRGKTATVLAVNPSWHFVVLDKGIADKIKTEYVAFVHRGRDYVGKLQVVRVEDNLAIAEIIPNSTIEPGIKPGDQIFF